MSKIEDRDIDSVLGSLTPKQLAFLESNFMGASTIDDLCWSRRDFREVLRLARLGLWAEEHGIPLAKAADSYHSSGHNDDWHYMHDNSKKAILALPPGTA